jgi:cyclic-di-GMP-binding protein
MTDDAAPPAPGATPSPSPDRKGAAFRDAEGAKAWTRTLPFGSVADVCALLQQQLSALAETDIPARERATIAEIMREQVAHVHTELARRYAGKPQPVQERERDAADRAIALWRSLWQLYSLCLKPLLDGEADLAGVKAKLLQRSLYVGKQLVLVHGLARRSVPGEVWHELHAYYRIAELLECTGSAVSDDLIPLGVGISCYSTFSHALLLALADPYALRVKEIELADRWLSMWARKVLPYAETREAEGPALVIDLDAAAGAVVVDGNPSQRGASIRYGYPAKLATSVRGRLKRLQSGATPAELQLGQDCSTEQCMALLGHLFAHWYQLPREPDDARSRSIDLCGGGLPAAYFRVHGRTFERPDPYGRGTARAHQQSLRAITEYDQGREEAELRMPWEPWSGRGRGRDLILTRKGSARQRWTFEQLAVVRDDDRLRLGYVTRIEEDSAGGMQLTLRCWPVTPRALVLRSSSLTIDDDPPTPAMLLPESPEDKASIVLPPRAFSAGRSLRCVGTAPERKLRLTRLLQRGADFDRAEFDDVA